jgi:hypothetical protein
MMRHTGLVALAALLMAGGALPASAQLEDNLSAYTDETAEGYLKPLQEAFGQALNSNLFTGASIPQAGLRARLEIRAMSVFFGSDDETFLATSGGDFTPVTQVEASTVVGPGASVSVTGDGGTQYVFPGGFDIGSLTIGVPQLTVGGFRGTEAVLRWIPTIDTGDAEIGEIKLFGLGARHSISQYLVDFPVDLAASISYHKFSLGEDLLDASAFSLGAQGSRGFGLVTVFGGLSFDTFSMTAEYTAKSGAEDEDVKLDLESENSLHLTAGAALSLGVVHLHLAGDLAQRTGISGGLGFGF